MIKFEIDDRGLICPLHRPLICTVTYGTDEHFVCLNLLLASLFEFGRYDGEVAIFSDRSLDHVMTYVPGPLKSRTLWFPLRDTSLLGRYTIMDHELGQYSPTLYLDNDIIVDNDIRPYLKRISREGGICVTTERTTYAEFVSQKVAEINDVRRIGNWFGLELLRADTDCLEEFLPVANSGILGFRDAATFSTVASLIRQLYRHPCHSDLAKYFADQPFLNYVLAKTKLGSYEALRESCRFLGSWDVPVDQPRGFAHFVWARGEDKIFRMTSYLEQLGIQAIVEMMKCGSTLFVRSTYALAAPRLIVNHGQPGFSWKRANGGRSRRYCAQASSLYHA